MTKIETTRGHGGEDRANNFDLIRLLAAAQVALWHGIRLLEIEPYTDVPETWNVLPGVPVFFVVSGFLVTLSWERSRTPVQYFVNRLLRIYPALWVCLAISLGMIFAFRLPWTPAALATWVTAQLSVAQFWNPEFLRGFGVGVMNGSLWTIPVELQFYVAIPLLYLGARLVRGSGAGLVRLAVAVAALGAFTAWSHEHLVRDDARPWTKMYDVTLVPWLYYFMVGLLCRRLFELRPGLFRGRLPAWLLAYGAWTAFAKWGLGWEVVGNMLNPVSLLFVGGVTISAAFTMPSLSNRLLHGNDISYGMYIYHMLVLNLFVQIGFKGSLLSLACMLALTLALGVTSWRLVERPALELKRHPIWGRVAARLGVVASRLVHSSS